jgi:putative Holliday junction resolvase
MTSDTNTRCLGLDVGERRIGLAISDTSGRLATPYTAINRRGQEKDIAAILRVVSAEEIGTIVVGMPFSLNGSMGPQATWTLAFCEVLQAATPLPVETWDERYSSVEAARLLREAGAKPSRDKARLDASAAAVILQGYLDAQRQATP